MTLLELAERCEAAEGPDRDLDAAIYCAKSGFKYPSLNCAEYTASLDAALTLVPVGWCWMAGERDRGRCRAYVNNGEPHFRGMGAGKPNPAHRWFEVVAATPALALCAAALRAQASGETPTSHTEPAK